MSLWHTDILQCATSIENAPLSLSHIPLFWNHTHYKEMETPEAHRMWSAERKPVCYCIFSTERAASGPPSSLWHIEAVLEGGGVTSPRWAQWVFSCLLAFLLWPLLHCDVWPEMYRCTSVLMMCLAVLFGQRVIKGNFKCPNQMIITMQSDHFREIDKEIQ